MNRPPLPNTNPCPGFTLLEITVVIIIMAALAGVVATQAVDTGVDAAAELEAVKGHLRYAQSRAMAASRAFSIRFEAQSYSLRNNAGDILTLPGTQTPAVPLEHLAVASGSVVLFDRLGRPFTDGAGSTAQSGIRTLASTDAGSLTICPETGFIP